MTLENQKSRNISNNENTNVSVIKPTIKMCVFGTCLDNLTKNSAECSVAVPFVVSRLCCYIERYGLLQQNLNEEIEEMSEVDYLKKEFDESGDASLELRGNVSTAMKLLKLFLEELPEPLIPASMRTAFLNVKQNISNSSDCIQRLKSLVSYLPTSAFCVLKYLSHFLLHMAKHEERNGLNPVNLSIIFGPIIFRSDKKDPTQRIVIRNITRCFVVDYYTIFGRNINLINEKNWQKLVPSEKRQVAPVPSSIAPVPSMEPLRVEIPPMFSSYGVKVKLNIQQDFPVFSVKNEKIDDVALKYVKAVEENIPKEIKLTSVPLARKRKETLLATDFSLSRNNASRIPKLVYISKNEILNDMDSVESLSNNHMKNLSEVYEAFHENLKQPLTNALVNEDFGGNHSPHPPDPKRRELEFFDSKKVHVDEKYRTHQRNFVKYYNDTKTSSSRRACKVKKSIFEKAHSNLSESSLYNEECMPLKSADSELNSDCSMQSKNIKDCNNNGDIYEIARPASCPVPDTEDDYSLETNQSTLSHSWSTLFEAEEPIISNRHFDWDVSKNSEEETEAVSPLVQYFRSSEHNSNIAPSPPVEHFQKSSVKEDSFSVPIKQLMKKIRGLKKKLKRFDEKYEADYGYKPSHAEKTNYPEAKKLLNELHKARKELRELKDEYHLVSSTNGSWLPTRDVHILEDTTNCLKTFDQNGSDSMKKFLKPSMHKSWDDALKCLDGDRKLAHRPELIEDMTTDQVKDEKLAIQKTLLHFESIHGKPSKKEDRNTIRPLYERYRNIKRLLVKSNSFPITSPKMTVCNSLEPIMEHETMDFGASVEEVKSDKRIQRMNCDFADAINQDINDLQHQSTSLKSLDSKYNNSNLHELPLPELIFQQHQARMEKRRIRKALREFESVFLKINGRKIQKEDKSPVESLYEEYKLVKARVRLLEALISKHHLEHASE